MPFLLFPQCFILFLKQISIFDSQKLSSANAFNLDRSEILSFGKGLRRCIKPLFARAMVIYSALHSDPRVNPFPNKKSLTLANLKSLQTTISNSTKMTENSPNVEKTLGEKEKLFVTTSFFFSPQCFKKTCTVDT